MLEVNSLLQRVEEAKQALKAKERRTDNYWAIILLISIKHNLHFKLYTTFAKHIQYGKLIFAKFIVCF